MALFKNLLQKFGFGKHRTKSKLGEWELFEEYAHLDASSADIMYKNLLASAANNPDEIDFTLLRLVYARSSGYDPYSAEGGLARARKEFGEISERGDPKATIDAANKVLDTNHMILSVHMKVALAYAKLGDEEKALYHQKFGKNWAKSIFQSGDGTSFQTAFVAISIDEEYAIVPVLGVLRGGQHLELQRQSIKRHRNSMFDILEVCDMQTGKKAKIYYNIDLIVRGVQEGRAKQITGDLMKSLDTPLKSRTGLH